MPSLLLSFLIGLLLGYYGWSIQNKLTQMHEEFQDRRAAKQVGVVRPVGIPATKNVPIDMTSDTGGVRKPTPAEIENQRQEDRAQVLRDNHK